MTVSDQDISSYSIAVENDLKKFWETGVVPYDDSTGLSHTTHEGVRVEGALIKAESRFKYFILPIISILLAIVSFWLIYKAFKSPRSKKRK